MAQPESALVKACLEYLALRGVFAWRNNTGAVKVSKRFVHFGTVGSPDIIGILPGGRWLGIECKIAPNKLSPAQHIFAADVRAAGGRWITAYKLEDVEEALTDA